jgi:chitin-binding protein
VYPSGIGSYGPGTLVRGTDGLLYECRPFPNSGWCNQAPLYYAPGTGSNWGDAWIRR